LALPVGPCANRKTVISFSHFFIRVLLSGSALSYPSAIMRLLAPLFASALLAALAVASTAVAQVRIGKLDSGKEFSRGESGFSRALHFSALFSFARHEASPGARIGEKTSRRSAEEREVFFRLCRQAFRTEHVPTLLTGFFGVSPQHCFRCSLFVFSPRRLFSSFASQHHAAED